MGTLLMRLTGAVFVSISFSSSAIAVPRNVGAGLREMVLRYEAHVPAPALPAETVIPLGKKSPADSTRRASSSVRRDTLGRVAVSVYLDGTEPVADVARRLTALGADVRTARDLTRRGEISAFVPVNKVSEMAALAGVHSMLLSHARFHVGAVTSEGARVLHTDVENVRGFTGDGVTVGVMSDSYDTSGGPITATNDIASGDLPGRGNPLGHVKPVVVLQDFPDGTDEGRGMLQIVHDLAPDSKLCFNTADIDPISFASAILDLADSVHGCGANVEVDDVSYDVEPYFSDGLIANAVNAVASAGVHYFSAAGNDNQEVYDSDFVQISNRQARRLKSPVDLSQVPADLTAGGFHNFGTDRNPDIFQQVSTADFGEDYLVFQWNDPWSVGGITTNYVLLVFDSKGRWLNDPEDPNGLGGVDDAFSTDIAFQEAFLPGPSDEDPAPVYYIAYARASTQKTSANHIRSLAFFGSAQYVTHTLPFSAQVYGHPAAAGATAVAADYWDDVKGTEYFSSLGPVRIYFDDAGNRLKRPVIRLKPDVAAVDGVHTTFFFQTVDDSGFPVFFGTSAAAPHAAAVAAILLQAAGGPNSLSPQLLRRTLINTAHAHSADDGHIAGEGQSSGLSVQLNGTGFLRLDPTKFTLTFNDSRHRNRTLQRFDVDVSPANLVVAGDFAVGDSGNMKAMQIKALTTVFPSPTLSIAFAPKAFRSGDEIAFGFRFAEDSILLLGRNVSLLTGARFRAIFSDGAVVTGTLNDEQTHDWSIASGFGLIDARAAVNSLRTRH